MNKKITELLFKTNAVRVCPENKPFWYTSGMIGPYYINTHFLYGNEEKALELLAKIDKTKENKVKCPTIIRDETIKNYNEDEIYKTVIDEMVGFIKQEIDSKEIEAISGGERRDWFFSYVIAEILDIPHITIYKDLTTVVLKGNKVSEEGNIKKKKVLHVADLITAASSYERAWVPVIKTRGAKMLNSLVVVDRLQGGKEVLNRLDVKSFSITEIDSAMFELANEKGYIKDNQLEMVKAYINDPIKSMNEFLLKHPEFMQNELKADDKTVARAKLCIEKGFYEANKTLI